MPDKRSIPDDKPPPGAARQAAEKNNPSAPALTAEPLDFLVILRASADRSEG